MSTETPSYNAISRPEATGGDLGRQRSQSESPDNLVDGTDHPDGGYEAWVTLFGCFCSFFAALSMMNSIGVYQSWISVHELSTEPVGNVGWISGFYNFMSFFAGIPLGPYFDARGPRFLSLCGALLLLVTYLLLGVCRRYEHFFLCFGVLGSISTCLLFTSAIGTIQHWFFHRRGFATGIAISGGSVGGIVSSQVLGGLLPKVGLAWTTRAIALIMLPFLTGSVLLMKSRPSILATSGSKKRIIPDATILMHRRTAVLALGALFVELGLFIPMTYIASYAQAQGMSLHTAYLMVTLMNVGSLLGRWLPGWLGDKLGRFNTQVAALSLCLVSILGIWKSAGDKLAVLTVFVLLFGLGSGSGISLVPVCIAQLCKTEDYGKYFTAIYSVGSFG
ncbi:hypothetical protein SEUCBS139899_004884 [Sporothrix eucalyptigena]